VATITVLLPALSFLFYLKSRFRLSGKKKNRTFYTWQCQMQREFHFMGCSLYACHVSTHQVHHLYHDASVSLLFPRFSLFLPQMMDNSIAYSNQGRESSIWTIHEQLFTYGFRGNDTHARAKKKESSIWSIQQGRLINGIQKMAPGAASSHHHHGFLVLQMSWMKASSVLQDFLLYFSFFPFLFRE
jgi:hypothetical protein